MRFKPGHSRLRSRGKPSVLGSGLLERVRSTTLALLGATTAVGLAMVALALNQSWPLLADSPLPLPPPRQQAVGEATVAAGAVAGARGPADALASRPPASARSHPVPAGDRGGAAAPDGGPAPAASTELVVAPSAPAEPKRGDVPEDAGSPSPSSPVVQSPPASAPAAASVPAQPAPVPQAPPAAEAPPPPTSAEVPIDPSGDDDWDDDGDDWDDDWDDDGWDDGGWDDHGHDHGHHWSRGRHDD